MILFDTKGFKTHSQRIVERQTWKYLHDKHQHVLYYNITSIILCKNQQNFEKYFKHMKDFENKKICPL